MKKKILIVLNEQFVYECTQAVNATFGIELSMVFDLIKGYHVTGWKSQGVVKDRAIRYYIDGYEAAYKMAMQIVSNIDKEYAVGKTIDSNSICGPDQITLPTVK